MLGGVGGILHDMYFLHTAIGDMHPNSIDILVPIKVRMEGKNGYTVNHSGGQMTQHLQETRDLTEQQYLNYGWRGLRGSCMNGCYFIFHKIYTRPF